MVIYHFSYYICLPEAKLYIKIKDVYWIFVVYEVIHIAILGLTIFTHHFRAKSNQLNLGMFINEETKLQKGSW